MPLVFFEAMICKSNSSVSRLRQEIFQQGSQVLVKTLYQFLDVDQDSFIN